MNELGAGVGALFFVVVLVVGIGGLAFWIVALIDCIKFSDEVYRAAGSEKVTWVLIVALAGWIGGLIYWFSIRSRLHEVERSGVAAVAPWYAPYPGYGAAPTTPLGWYRDPWADGQMRWWDGQRWTEHTTPTPSP